MSLKMNSPKSIAVPPRTVLNDPSDNAVTNIIHFIPRRRPQDGRGNRRPGSRPHSIGATIISNPKLVKDWELLDISPTPNQRNVQRHLSAIQLGQDEETAAGSESTTLLASHKDKSASFREGHENENGGQIGGSHRTSFVYYNVEDGDQELVEEIGDQVDGEVKAQVAPKKEDSCFEITNRILGPILGILFTLLATTYLSIADDLMTPDAAQELYWTQFSYHPYTLLAWTSQGLFWVSAIVLLCPRLSYVFGRVSLRNIYRPPTLLNSRGGTILLLLLRAIFGWTAALLIVWSRTHITPDTVNFLACLSPLPALLLACLLLQEKIGWIPFLAAILVTLGIVCLIPPHLESSNSFSIGCSCAAGALLLEGVLAPLILRKLKHIHVALVTFTYGIIGTAGGIYFYYAHHDLWSLPKSWQDIFVAGILCGLVLLGHIALTAALKSETVGIVVVVRCWFVPMMYEWDIWYKGKPSDWLSFVGELLIVFAIVVLAARKSVQSRPRLAHSHKILKKLVR